MIRKKFENKFGAGIISFAMSLLAGTVAGSIIGYLLHQVMGSVYFFGGNTCAETVEGITSVCGVGPVGLSITLIVAYLAMGTVMDIMEN